MMSNKAMVCFIVFLDAENNVVRLNNLVSILLNKKDVINLFRTWRPC